MLSWDTETRSFRWWEDPAFLASWTEGGDDGNVVVLPAHTDAPAAGGRDFAQRLEGETHHNGANTKFDAHMAASAFGVDIFKPGNVVDDVLMMSRLLYGARRQKHGLKELATDFIDEGAKDAETAMSEAYKSLTGKSDMRHDDSYYITWAAFPDLVEKYAALDAVYTHKLHEILRPKLAADAKLESLYVNVERPVQSVLYEAERQGVQVDPEAVQRLTEHYNQRDSAARGALQRELGFVPEGEGSQDALREGLLRAGVPLTEVTENTGELAVNRGALSKFADHPAVAALFEFRRVAKFLSTYIMPLTGAEHIHPTFNQAQAWTGRMSGMSPNMQNLPKRTETSIDENLRIRSVFVPSPGMEFIIGDYESIEVGVLAYYLGDKPYRKLIAEGDPHTITAAAAFGGSPADYGKGTAKRWLRDIAKQATYAIVYGGGGPVIMDTINKMVLDAGHPEYLIDLDQARAIRRKITGAIPGFTALTQSPYKGKTYPQGRLYQQLLASYEQDGDKAYGFVRTLLGRKQWISLDKAYVALSGLIQGSAADIMKAGAINVSAALKPYGGTPILFVHDEIVAEVPLGWGERLMPIMVDAMEQAATLDPALKVEAHVTARSYAHAD